MTDIATIRARHAHDEALLQEQQRGGTGLGHGWGPAHANRAALLAAYDSACAEVVDVVNANVRLEAALDRAETALCAARATVNEFAERLDRLAGVLHTASGCIKLLARDTSSQAVDDVLAQIQDVLALVRARVEGRDA